MMESIKIHIWSDIACPFCYIGKARLFKVLPENASIVWHSFILQPFQVTQPELTLTAFLAQSKGWSVEQTRAIQNQVTSLAADEGLFWNMDKVIPANTRRAHALLQLHKLNGNANMAKEQLFEAYFVNGLNIDDEEVLFNIHISCGGTEESWQQIYSKTIQEAIDRDLEQAAAYTIKGVPYFYFENAFSISGAQPISVFQEAMTQLMM
jgi:predicted DsbA family dithiol-disulfide isomerase